MVSLIRTATELAEKITDLRLMNADIGLVPTMGNLHEGHLSLVKASNKNHSATIVTIYVNPTQFGEGEDLGAYPRTLEQDLEKLSGLGEGNIFVFCPEADKEIYPSVPMINFSIPDLENTLCGLNRPGHFNGVMQVIYRLFNMVKPDTAYFGKKDFQQLRIIQSFAKEMFPEINVIGLDIIREKSGLAMSSRNNYLTQSQKEEALHLRDTLNEAKTIFLKKSKDVYLFLDEEKKKNNLWDYLEILDSDKLSPPTTKTKKFLIAGAYKLGRARIIDNITFDL